MPEDRARADRRIDDPDDRPSNPSVQPSFAEIVERRYNRRHVLGAIGAGAATAAVGGIGAAISGGSAKAAVSTLGFTEVAHDVTADMAVAPGYNAQVLIRWGDKVTERAPDFDVDALTAESQAEQFGYNNDFIAYFPLPIGSQSSEHALLVVNHEYTDRQMMFSGVRFGDDIDKDKVDVEMAAHGASVIEVRKTGNAWSVVHPSRFARRLALSSTEMDLSGPAAGHDLMRTAADPSGKVAVGTLNNCAGGWTPWGTVLLAEENFNLYFGGDPAKMPQADDYARYGVERESRYSWWRHHDRFNVEKEPNEPNRFGWIVEFDPYDPESKPKKRTAMGRFKHEGATTALTPDGRVAVYSGDDQRFDYLYKFVTAGRYNPRSRPANRDLLDEGTLYVARFDTDGSLTWLPLTFGQGPLTPERGFNSQAEVLIKTRQAADALGATPMDRPEDVEPNPVTGRVYVMLTNNHLRTADQADDANPRGPNPFGHVVELLPPGGDGARDHGALKYQWRILLKGGDPANPAHRAAYHPDTSSNGWLASPDNCAFDPRGRLWIATDQGTKWKATGIADGIYACDLAGPGRALTKHFFRVPIGAEMCGPAFTPDGRTLFVAVQHPGADGAELDQNFDNPMTRWPDFQDGMPPRPSVVAITKQDGGEIGS